ncbi:hypothetical protein BACCOPRO_02072 [Phocaeicola coprophilus DSM 18228 = JCM 13818]|uniref:Uncharacterized protein n=1 Tax=Phocaeicola coprophilus DSM 18228 = JCM 13818 TaxID=547042 RepID=S0F9X7_9BACT|nr:hypothetical protein BACCOPRO_02072 [Phocaeicola coprophilus DSM 18228 = JCM 13818]
MQSPFAGQHCKNENGLIFTCRKITAKRDPIKHLYMKNIPYICIKFTYNCDII